MDYILSLSLLLTALYFLFLIFLLYKKNNQVGHLQSLLESHLEACHPDHYKDYLNELEKSGIKNERCRSIH